MQNILRSLLLVAVLGIAQWMPAQTSVKALIEDENANLSVATYDYGTNTLSSSFPLTGASFGNFFYSESTTFNHNTNEMITAADSGIITIDVLNGGVTMQPFPFSVTNGFSFVTFLIPGTTQLYCLIEDSNGDYSVAAYDYVASSLSNSNSLNGTSLAQGGFFAGSATFDSQTDEILVSGDNGIHAVNVQSGALSTNAFPFSAAMGYNLSLHYDPNANKTFALVEDSNGDTQVAVYDFATNSLSNSFSLNGTAVGNGFYSEGAGYDPMTKKIIVATDNGIASVDVTNGTVVTQAFPFAATNGFEVVFRGWPIMVNTAAANLAPSFTLFPNPVAERVHLSFDEPTQGEVKLLDLKGSVLKTMSFQGSVCDMDLQDLAAGTYLLQIQSRTGTTTRQLVVD